MTVIILLLTILLIVAYLLRDRFSITFIQRHEKQFTVMAAAAAVIGGLVLFAHSRGFEPRLGIVVGAFGILTLIARQQTEWVLHTFKRLGCSCNPFAHRLFSPILGWPLFFMGLIIATPPALWVDLIGVAIVYVIAIGYARWTKA